MHSTSYPLSMELLHPTADRFNHSLINIMSFITLRFSGICGFNSSVLSDKIFCVVENYK